MIGVPTGPVNGITVLDLDVREDYDGCENLRELGLEIPHTLTSLTPSGGRHYYFATGDREIKCSASKISQGVDVRGIGGYVVAPPSNSVNGNYTWLKAPFDNEASLVVDQFKWAPLMCDRLAEIRWERGLPRWENDSNGQKWFSLWAMSSCQC